MKKAIRRLRLRDGDIIVVRDYDTAERLARMEPIKETPKCPILVAPDGIHRLNRDYLRKVLERSEEVP